MPRQEARAISLQKASLASVVLHAFVFAVFVFAGTGGDAGIAGDGSGGSGMAMTEIIRAAIVSPETAAPGVAGQLSGKFAKSPAKKPAQTPVKKSAEKPGEKLEAAATAIAAIAAIAGGAGGGTGRGGVGEASSPGTVSGSGSPFGFSLAEVSGKPGIVKRVPVVYPVTARQKRVTGRVLVRFHLDAAGAVSHLSIKSADPPGVFNENTLAAVRQWRFSPAKMGGKAVPVWVELPIEFNLRR